MKTHDVIIPHYSMGKLNVLAAWCLRSIQRNSEDYRVIWVQNGGPVPGSITRELAGCEEVSVIRMSQNVGFVRATNAGIRQSDAPYVVLMNNDAEAVEGWLDKLRAALSGNVGIAGPLSTAPGSWQGRRTAKAEHGTVVLPREANLAFFCAMIRREVIERVGLLDEGFGIGFGDDDDYCRRTVNAGYRLALVQDLRIPHKHRSTFRALFSRTAIHGMQHRAAQLLREKAKA